MADSSPDITRITLVLQVPQDAKEDECTFTFTVNDNDKDSPITITKTVKVIIVAQNFEELEDEVEAEEVEDIENPFEVPEVTIQVKEITVIEKKINKGGIVRIVFDFEFAFLD